MCPDKYCSIVFSHNFNTFRHSFAIFDMNHHADQFYYKNRQFIPTIITSISSADIIVTPLETTLSCIPIDFAGHRYTTVLTLPRSL